jgi:hypothetical protein
MSTAQTEDQHCHDFKPNRGNGTLKVDEYSVRRVVEKLAGKRGHDR